MQSIARFQCIFYFFIYIWYNTSKYKTNRDYIYFKSPIGKGLIGKKEKDVVTVTTPSGEKNFEVTEQSKKSDKISIDKLENIRNNWFKDYISIIN